MHEFSIVRYKCERAFIKEKQLRGGERGSSPSGRTRSTFWESSIWLIPTILETFIVSCFKCPVWGAAVSDNVPLLFAARQPSPHVLDHTTIIPLSDHNRLSNEKRNVTNRSQTRADLPMMVTLAHLPLDQRLHHVPQSAPGAVQ
jgi:hypothetical protein